MNNNYDADNFNNEHWRHQVIAIHICGYINEENKGDEVGNPPTNHWAMFLDLGESRSVRLDMTPGYGSDGLRGKIDVASKNYVHTRNAMKTLSFPAKLHFTVEYITQFINSKRLDRYKFTDDWEGCRFWIYTLIKALGEAGLIDEDSGQSTWNAVSYYWRNPSGQELRTVQQGTFY